MSNDEFQIAIQVMKHLAKIAEMINVLQEEIKGLRVICRNNQESLILIKTQTNSIMRYLRSHFE